MTDFFRKKAVKIILIVLCVTLLLAGGVFLFVYPAGRIARGVCIEGTSIGRMTKEEAKDALDAIGCAVEKNYVIEDITGAKTEISATDISVLREVDKTVEKAYEIGRSGDLLKDTFDLVRCAFLPGDFRFEYSYNREKISEILYDFGVGINGELVEYIVSIDGDMVNVSAGVDGQNKDVSVALLNVEDAIVNGKEKVVVMMENTAPPKPSEMSLCDFLYTAPVDASYTVNNGVIEITEEVTGISVNPEEVAEKISALENGETITLKANISYPAVRAKDLYDKLLDYTMGSYSTKYSVRNKSRTANVVLAASLIDGAVVAPGEVFSYNGTVGRRTTARGFMQAPIYSDGAKVMGIGGGICQVSSTLYSAVLYADLEVVERASHSMLVDYMPKGQDAAVSYGSIDFKFRNNTKNPIIIKSVAKGGVLTISIMGTKPEVEKKVTLSAKTVEVIEKTVVEIPDETLPVGTEIIEDSGITGYVVETYKKVYENGVEVKNKRINRSRYRMVPIKKRVGTKAVETAQTEVVPEVTTE